jgi:transcriptional regulator with XRE-family HTH domain
VRTLGLILRDARTEKELSLRAVGRKAKISGMFLCDIEKGRRFPSEKTLKVLAKILGIKTAFGEWPCRSCRGRGTKPGWGLVEAVGVDAKGENRK